MTSSLHMLYDTIKSELIARFDDGHDVIFGIDKFSKSGKSADRLHGEIVTLKKILDEVNSLIEKEMA